MNPWAFLVILLGIVLIIVGIKGTQHSITSAITGVAHGGSSYPAQTAPSQSPSSTPAKPGGKNQPPMVNPYPLT